MKDSTTKPRPKIDMNVKEKINECITFESQVTIHIRYKNNTSENQLLRIWKSTYLFSANSIHKSKLLYFYNIPIYPKFKQIKPSASQKFTLIFSGLPKGCKAFHLIEQIPEPGGFCFKNIIRNTTDVYYLNLGL